MYTGTRCVNIQGTFGQALAVGSNAHAAGIGRAGPLKRFAGYMREQAVAGKEMAGKIAMSDATALFVTAALMSYRERKMAGSPQGATAS